MHSNVVVNCMDGKYGKFNFTIYQTPLVEDHQDPGLQREYTPAVPENDVTGLPASVPLRLHKATEATTWKPATRNDFGDDYLVAVKSELSPYFIVYSVFDEGFGQMVTALQSERTAERRATSTRSRS